MRIRSIVLLLGAFALWVLTPAVSSAEDAPVSAVDDAFDPPEVQISKGDSVTWTNDGDADHTATASDGSFESGNLDPGESFTQTFDEAGEFPYYCEYHGTAEGEGMAGTVVVAEGQDGTPTTDETDAPDDDVGGTGRGDDLPETGSEIAGFLYIGLALIGAGLACLKAESTG
ncbi:MAG: cupredoxin domain-containing protein [Actinomycetota bacterium]|nr:cupredoxin domain-containing protein [Actinomycetota bacterium]